MRPVTVTLEDEVDCRRTVHACSPPTPPWGTSRLNGCGAYGEPCTIGRTTMSRPQLQVVLPPATPFGKGPPHDSPTASLPSPNNVAACTQVPPPCARHWRGGQQEVEVF